MLLVGPILVFSALGVTATVMNIDTVQELLAVDALGQAARTASRLTPYLLVIAAFTFVYLFIPNTRVRFVPALIGGAVGGIAWQTAGWIFAVFVVSSNKYAAIYSGFAILILFMIWLYLSWLILLFGASVSFYAQHPEYLYSGDGEPRLSNRMRERLALSMMSLVAGRFVTGERAPTLAELTRRLGVPTHTLRPVLDTLERTALVASTAVEPPTYLPARDPSLITATQVLDAVRLAGEDNFLAPGGVPAPPPIDDVLERMRDAVESSIGEVTLRELAAPGTESSRRVRAGTEAGSASAPRRA